MTAAGPAAERLPTWRKVGYASGDLGLNVYWQGISLFLFFFYTDVMGIPVWWAGFTIFVASVWDGVTDPVMGAIADRTRTKRGRYRPYLLFGAPVLAVGFVAAFLAPPGLTGGMLVAYALITHLLLRTLYTVLAIPYAALSARMTPDSSERGALAGWRMQAAALGGLTTAFATPAIVQLMSNLAGGDPRLGWAMAALVMAATATAILWLCFATTTEPTDTEAAPAGRGPGLHDILAAAAMLRRNGPLARVFIAIIMASLCLAMMSKTLLYWFKYAVGNEAAAGPALAVTPLVLLVMAPIWVAVARATSKRTAFLAGCGIACAGYLGFFFLPMHEPLAIYVMLAVIAIGASAFAVMFWAMLPDTVEYDEWVSGARQEARVFGFATFAQKAALGLNALLLGILLDLIGFTPNVEQTEATLTGLKAIMGLIPALGAAATLVALWGYPIDQRFHDGLRASIAERDAALASTRAPS